MINSEQLKQSIQDIPTFPGDSEGFTDSAKEFIFRTYEFFEPLDLELLTTFLKDKIEINLHSITFHNKYADIVFHPNVGKYEEVESYLAREILKILDSTK